MKKIIMLAALVLASCSYDYKVKVDTDTIKYVIEYPAADITQTSTKIIEIKEEPAVIPINSDNCKTITKFMNSEIFLNSYCNSEQMKNYTCCRVPYNAEENKCMVHLCYTKVVENYNVSCLGFSDECY
jgi:hypothetical protein